MTNDYDLLNQMLTAATKKLKSLKPWRSVWVSQYGFSKDIDNEWHIIHTGLDGSLREITCCPIDIRVYAATQVVKQLHAKILEDVGRLDDSILEAIDKLAEYLQ